ncbi:MAG: fatty acyl-AMP ligase, partial [Cyanobacteria bacterium P01_G01_bin.49]
MLPQNSTLVDLLQHRAIYQPQHTGYVFLSNGKTEEIKLSYQSLEQQAKVIAARLQKMNLMGERALLLYYPGLDFITAFLGCLYAGVVAVPVYPPQGVQQLFRLDAIAADAQVKIVLTATTLLGDIQQYFSPTVKFAHLAYLATDALDRNLASCWEKPTLNSDTLAFLQYTSGSTGNPKGVMVSHGNLLQNSANILRGFNHNTNSRVVSWLPHYHDMGLIGGILQPLFGGFPVILMSPASFLRKPIRWLQAISGYQATTSGGPNFAYNLCLQKITAEQKATLDLSSWEVAFIGAEPISPKTLDQFAEAFAPCGFRREAFYPCYGLAEATLFVTGKAQKAEGNSPLPPENEEKRSNVWLPQTNKSEAS